MNAKLNAQELVGKTKDELQDTLMKLRKEQFTLRMQHVAGQLTNPASLRLMRRDIARVKTAINGGLTASSVAKPIKEAKKAAVKKPAEAKTTTTKTSTAQKAPAKKPAVKKTAEKTAK